MDPGQKRIHLRAGPYGFTRQMACYETKIRQEIICSWKALGMFLM